MQKTKCPVCQEPVRSSDKTAVHTILLNENPWDKKPKKVHGECYKTTIAYGGAAHVKAAQDLARATFKLEVKDNEDAMEQVRKYSHKGLTKFKVIKEDGKLYLYGIPNE